MQRQKRPTDNGIPGFRGAEGQGDEFLFKFLKHSYTNSEEWKVKGCLGRRAPPIPLDGQFKLNGPRHHLSRATTRVTAGSAEHGATKAAQTWQKFSKILKQISIHP
jgi:hypothetical protein